MNQAIAERADSEDHGLVVVVFLRGGADGLSLVPPVGDDDYYRIRPRIAVSSSEALPLDGFFALHPALHELHRWYREGHLEIVHAVGSDDDTRSHFEAQDLMEHGGRSVAGGWLGRWLRSTAQGEAGAGRAAAAGALDAIALGRDVPESLRGAPGAVAMRSVADLDLSAPPAFRTALAGLYADDWMLGPSASQALTALDRLQSVRCSADRPHNGADYADDEFSFALSQLARLVHARVGLRAACIDLHGWDSHIAQRTAMEPRMRSLARGLSAFATDLGPLLAHTSVVVMTEFGRRVTENSALGTDHGRGSVMFILGGGVSGGTRAKWPGLRSEALESPGDLPVTLDYRDILASVLTRHGYQSSPEAVFPDLGRARTLREARE